MCRIDPDGMADYNYYIDGIRVDPETFHSMAHGRKERKQSQDDGKNKESKKDNVDVAQTIPQPLNPFFPPVPMPKDIESQEKDGKAISDAANDVYDVFSEVDKYIRVFEAQVIIETANLFAEHTKNARPSTEGKHQYGTKRKLQDKGGEKADENRRYNRKRPLKYRGKWPHSK